VEQVSNHRVPPIPLEKELTLFNQLLGFFIIPIRRVYFNDRHKEFRENILDSGGCSAVL
jgi:hypothetical protein